MKGPRRVHHHDLVPLFGRDLCEGLCDDVSEYGGVVEEYVNFPEALKGGLQILKDADLRAELGGLAMPATVIMGDKDHLIPPACATALKDLQPALNVRVIENAGHVLFLSHPKQLLDIVVSGL